jgi:GDP-L-fucose synthase
MNTSPDFWNDKKVLVTGGTGFIGSHVVEMLVERGAIVRVATSRKLSEEGQRNLSNVIDSIEVVEANLADLAAAEKATAGQQIVINAAAKVAGVHWNMNHPATMFRENMLIGMNVLEAAKRSDVERFLVVSSACVYPRHCSIPTPETEGFKDEPEPTNVGYGWAKRMSEFLGRAYNEEHGMTVAIARPYNAYGPRDNFDPERSHVVPGIIHRLFTGENPFHVWGDGEQSRSFLYVKDFARGLIEVVEKYPEADALNLGANEEVKVKDLVKLIMEIADKSDVPVVFDTSKPSGQPRRCCDTTKAEEKIDWKPEYSLRKGLEETIAWYRDHKDQLV